MSSQYVRTQIQSYLATQKIRPIALVSELPIEGKSRDERWLVIENTTIESDL